MKKVSLFLIALGIIFIFSVPSYAYTNGGQPSNNALASAFIYGYRSGDTYSTHGYMTKTAVENLTRLVLSQCSSKFYGNPILIKECIKGWQARLRMEYLYISISAKTN